MYKTLVEAIYERYNEMLDGNTFIASSSPESLNCDQQTPSQSSYDNKKDDNSLVSFYIPALSPRKTRMVITSCSLVMSDQNINEIGDYESLKRSCKNVIELDLSRNQVESWDEVKKLLCALKNLRLLNLSHNYLLSKALDLNKSSKHYFNEWPDIKQLKILILNSCYINLKQLKYLLNKLTNLIELHLCSNNYDKIDFNCDEEEFIKNTLKILYLNNNRICNWLDVCKLGKCFPMLETLVISDNPDLSNFNDINDDDDDDDDYNGDDEIIDNNNKLHTSSSFSQLQQLIINKLSINEWSIIDQLRKFPQLKHVRIQNIPLLEHYTDEEKYYLLVAHLDGPTALNGSEITPIEKENCERKFIRYYLDKLNKPKRFYELESKHGKLNKLADINLVANNNVYVKIKFDQQCIYETIDVRLTVGEFKKKLEKFVGQPSNKFRVFYIDVEALGMLGPEELKHPNRCLHSFNINDGDEFEIDLKQPVVVNYHHTPSATPLFESASTSSLTTSQRNKAKPIIKTTKSATNLKQQSSSGSNKQVNRKPSFGKESLKLKENDEEQQQQQHQPMTPSPTPPSTPNQQNNETISSSSSSSN